MNHTQRNILKKAKGKIRLEAKRAVELWIYSFADMYMILVFLFIAMSAVYLKRAEDAAKLLKERPSGSNTLSAGRGPAVAHSTLSIEFKRGSSELSESAVENLGIMLPLVKNNSLVLLDIEGYADASPLLKTSPFTSNLDLSSKRAVSVAEWFLSRGLSPGRIRTYSYGNGQLFSNNGGVKTDRRVLVKMYMKGGGG